MKPKTVFLSQINHYLKCESYSTSISSGLRLSSLWQRWLGLVRTNLQRLNGTKISKSLKKESSGTSSLKTIVLAAQEVAATKLSSLRSLSHSKSLVKAFPRIVVGVVCAVVMAPYADVFYTRLDYYDRVSPEVWYYESWHWLFLCLGPYLKGIFATLGWYLILGVPCRLIAFPLAVYFMIFDAGKILWLLQVSNHDEYKALPTAGFLWSYGLLAGIFIISMADLLTYWLNHRVEAIKRRLHGIKNLVGKVDDRTVLTHFIQTVEDDIKIQQFKTH